MSTYKMAFTAAVLVALLATLFAIFDTTSEVSEVPLDDIFSKTSGTQPHADQEGVTYTNASGKDIQITLPLPESVTGSDFTIRGVASQAWFQDDAFAVAVLGGPGEVLYEGLAKQNTAEGDTHWSFSGDISIAASYSGPALLILAKGQVGDLETGTYVALQIQVEP